MLELQGMEVPKKKKKKETQESILPECGKQPVFLLLHDIGETPVVCMGTWSSEGIPAHSTGLELKER